MLIHNADITGSLTINGIPYNTGSFSGSFIAGTNVLSGDTVSLTGSLLGTASFASNAQQSVSSSFASTASFALNSVNNNTGSFTGSFIGDGSQLTGVTSSIQPISTVSDTFTSVTSYTVTHNFNTKEVIVSVYENDTLIFPSSITTPTTNTVTITFPEPVTGRVVVVKAGHIVSGSIDYSNVLNKPTLVSGSSQVTYSGLTGIPSGIVSGSAQVTYSGLTGIPSGIVSGSAQIASFGIFATTGSNGFNGSQSITGSLTVTGQVVAQTLNVQQVTSSVVYSSGSNVFGNSLANTQQLTGSVNVTGSFTVTTSGVELQVTNTGVNLGNALTDSHIISGSLRVNPNGLFVSGSGNVGIGTTNPEALSNNTTLQIDGTNHSFVRTGTSNYGGYFATIPTADVLCIANVRNPVTGTYSNTGKAASGINLFSASSNGYITFLTTDSNNSSPGERMRITSSGRVGIGTDTPGANLHVVRANDGGSGTPGVILSTANGANDIVRFQDGTTTTAVVKNDGSIFAGSSTGVTLNSLTNRLSVSSTTYNLFDISRFSNNAFGPNFYLVKSRNGSIGGNTIVENGDNLGNINWIGANGTGFTDAASIKAEVDGTPGASNDMPGRLVFSTTADGAGSATERMRITSGGNVGIGITGPSEKLEVNGSLRLSDGNADGPQLKLASSGFSDWNIDNFSGNLRAYYGSTEYLRVTSGGNVGIGTTSPGAKLTVGGSFMCNSNQVALTSTTYSSFSSGNADYPITFITPGGTFVSDTYIVTVSTVDPSSSTNRRFAQSIIQIMRNNSSATSVVHNLHNISNGSIATVTFSAESLTVSGFTLRVAFGGASNATIMIQASSQAGILSI